MSFGTLALLTSTNQDRPTLRNGTHSPSLDIYSEGVSFSHEDFGLLRYRRNFLVQCNHALVFQSVPECDCTRIPAPLTGARVAKTIPNFLDREKSTSTSTSQKFDGELLRSLDAHSGFRSIGNHEKKNTCCTQYCQARIWKSTKRNLDVLCVIFMSTPYMSYMICEYVRTMGQWFLVATWLSVIVET